MRDGLDKVNARVAIAPVVVSDNTAQVGNIIDTQGYEKVTFLIALGTLVDADATFAVTVQHGDAANLSDVSTPSTLELLGGTTLAGFDFSADGAARKIGYIGSKRYVRLTVTPTNNTGAAPISALALLSGGTVNPQPNPPV
jgi:hypothetical protein